MLRSWRFTYMAGKCVAVAREGEINIDVDLALVKYYSFWSLYHEQTRF